MAIHRELTVIGAPTSRASHTGGQEKAPAVLRAAGIVGLLNARGFDVHDHGDLPVARFRPDPTSPRAHNVSDVVEIAGDVRALVARAVNEGRWPLVLGGDCTIALGAVAGLIDARGDASLLYFDAHGDLNLPDRVPYGALDWMGVAHALNAPGSVAAVAQAGPRTPLLTPDRVTLLGTVREQITECEHELMARYELPIHDCDEVAAAPAESARRALARHERTESPTWLHFDVDVIDSVDLPIADFFQLNGGLPFAAATTALRELAGGRTVLGMSISQFNPDHTDEHGIDAARFVRGVVDALAGR